MHTLSTLAMVDLGQVARQTGETFGFDLAHFLAQLVSFAIVAVVLKRFAYDPLIRALDERHERIARSHSDAEHARLEVERTKLEREVILAEANRQAARLLEEARAAAVRLGDEERRKAVEAAARIMAQAKAAALAEQERLRTELKREVGRLVLVVAARVTGKIMTTEDHARMADETRRVLSA